MSNLPATLEEAIVQAQEATQAALAAGLTRLQVELAFPELKPMPVARQFLTIFENLGPNLKVLFSDAGAGALARRDWGEMPCVIRGLGELKAEVQPDDRLFLIIAPSSVEVAAVEKLCETVGERPVVLLNPRLEDVATVGIGYAGRQLRTRFLSTIESCYYLRPLEQAALFRCYPGLWQVWREENGSYQQVAEMPQRPSGEELDRLLLGSSEVTPDAPSPSPSRENFFTGLQRFLRALGR
ncbi:MAG: DUF1995 family protein [Leptolyngbyaceae cyanobacterium bins.59]|nr:DUF1995 family protein [Leptolyngbyaceae cyanobacterium bins.59]